MKQKQCIICNHFFSPNSSPQKFCLSCKEKAYKDNALKRANLYFQKNRKKVLIYRKNYYQKNKKIIIQKIIEYRKKFPEKTRRWSRNSHLRHRKQEREYTKLYRQKNPEWFKQIQTKYKHNKKSKLIQIKGGKCIQCGISYNGKNACIFQFHHKNNQKKDPKLKRGIGLWRKKDVLLKELEKCNLVCANCHLLLHYKGY